MYKDKFFTPNYVNKDLNFILSLLRFYEAKDSGKWPSQCYLFKSCGRKVETAAFDCSINAENTLEVKPFIKSEEECEMKCQEVGIYITVFIFSNKIKQFIKCIFIIFLVHLNFWILFLQNRKCGYYKYYGKTDADNQNSNIEDDDENEANDNELTRKSTSIDTSEFCYLLSSCSKRVIDNIQCDLGRNNFLDVRFFVPNVEECQAFCRDTPGCRYLYLNKSVDKI